MICVVVASAVEVNTRYDRAAILALRPPLDSPLPTQLLSNVKYLGELQGNCDVYGGSEEASGKKTS